MEEKILRFARCAIAVGNDARQGVLRTSERSRWVSRAHSEDPDFLQKYLGIRAEWVDMVEILRRIDLGIYDHAEYEKELAWIKKNCKKGLEVNIPELQNNAEQDEKEWEFIAKMTIISPRHHARQPRPRRHGLASKSRTAETPSSAASRVSASGPTTSRTADFTEAILNTTFDWNGKRPPFILATENDGLNGLAMLLLNLVTNRPAIFSDVRTYWSPDAVKRVADYEVTGKAANGFMHLINSGASALDGNGASKDENGESVMKEWWNVTDADMEAMLEATKWAPANKGYFRGGGFSSQYVSKGEMPVTMVRVNLVDKLGPVIQIAEGYTVELPDKVNHALLDRTDPTWPSIWFAPSLTGEGAFTDVYSVMANWGANHGASVYGHVGADIITLASMLRIPVSMHNVPADKIYRPHAWSAFGTTNTEDADYRACAAYGPLYK